MYILLDLLSTLWIIFHDLRFELSIYGFEVILIGCSYLEM